MKLYLHSRGIILALLLLSHVFLVIFWYHFSIHICSEGAGVAWATSVRGKRIIILGAGPVILKPTSFTQMLMEFAKGEE